MPYFEFDNKKVFYEVQGYGPPLLLLHGNTASSRMFEMLMDKYSKEFQLILIDYPGHGESDRLKIFEIDFWYYNAKVCYHLLEFLKLDKVFVAGTSGGALVAINLGLEHPERVVHIIADSFEGEYPLKSYMDSLESDREVGKKNTAAKLFWQGNHGSDWEIIVDLDTEMLINFSKQGRSFFHKSISDLSVPALLTGSKEDEFCDHLDTIYSNLKKKNDKLDIHLFEKGGHPAMLSNEEEFFEIVKKEIGIN